MCRCMRRTILHALTSLSFFFCTNLGFARLTSPSLLVDMLFAFNVCTGLKCANFHWRHYASLHARRTTLEAHTAWVCAINAQTCMSLQNCPPHATIHNTATGNSPISRLPPALCMHAHCKNACVKSTCGGAPGACWFTECVLKQHV